MQIITYLESPEELNLFSQANIPELILGHKDLSRFGSLDSAELLLLTQRCLAAGITPILEWDILMNEDVFISCQTLLNQLITHFSIVRVQDPGALEYILQKYPQVKVQLILEISHHNLEAILAWCEYVGPERLQRIVLSNELPAHQLQSYLPLLPCPAELLVLGPILIFYSPRSLLQPLKSNENKVIFATGKSEETPHKGFPLLENHHGTFMWYTKDLFLLEHLRELQEMGLKYIRADLRFGRPKEFLLQIKTLMQQLPHSFNLEAAQSLRKNYPLNTHRGFYSANKSDVLFTKLKNTHLLPTEKKAEEIFIGEVIDHCKGQYTAIHITAPGVQLTCPSNITVRNTEGKCWTLPLMRMYNCDNEAMQNAQWGDIVFTSFIPRAVPKSSIFTQPFQFNQLGVE